MARDDENDCEPIGGQPPADTSCSISDFDFELKRQRAFEAVLWAMPAVSIYGFRRAAFEALGYRDCDILAYTGTATPLLEGLTANSSTPYIGAYCDLRAGPAVLEVPPAGADGSLYGQVVDAWQFSIADVGPSGMDEGKGGRYLFTPPGYDQSVPDGYLHVASPNNRISFAFRSVRAPGKTAKDAYQYARQLRMYLLGDTKSPPEQKFIDPSNSRYPTLPFFDERYFRDLAEIVDAEPVREQDKVMMGMLATLGIRKGMKFDPDPPTVRAIRQGAVDAWHFLQQWYDNLPSELLFWPDRHYATLMQADDNRTFTFEYSDRIDLVRRAAQYVWCTYVPKQLSDTPATQYMMAMADRDGRKLEAGKLYKLDLPADIPVKQFWALTVYDRATFAFIYSDSNRTTLSSYDVELMTKNADGGITIYVGPQPPAGLEANWIPTSGKRPLPGMRLYGPTDEFNNGTFKLPDFELV
ncbi:DUF1254 domain-containing protein [Sphingomonas daechungensis]